jgi:hypothetical protein
MKAVPINLPYNLNAVSSNANPAGGALPNGFALPAEQFPAEIRCGGVCFKTGSIEQNEMNALACQGQRLLLPSGFTRLHIVAAAFDGDRQSAFLF